MAADTKPIIIKIRIPNWLKAPCIRIALLYRRLRYGYAFRRIPLTRGKYAIVDPEDFDRLNAHSWHTASDRGCLYARRTVRHPITKAQSNVHMHRQILQNVPDGMVVDHINHNGLDNREANVRPATHAQNQWNARKTKSPTRSKHKGIAWSNSKNRWRARITVNSRRIHLGYFKSQRDAAKAYDRAALKYHGDFAVLNFPR
jgi:hypothetical protein